MALHPNIARKAQEELDRVVGSERLPELSDRENLPYISAVIKELLRWSCPTPLGIPKRVMEDDVYNGNFIPAGATIFENIWCVPVGDRRAGSSTYPWHRAVCYNEANFEAPHTYDPERFLKDGELNNPSNGLGERVFGSGRRYARFLISRCSGDAHGTNTSSRFR